MHLFSHNRLVRAQFLRSATVSVARHAHMPHKNAALLSHAHTPTAHIVLLLQKRSQHMGDSEDVATREQQVAGPSIIPLDTAAQVEEAFRCSVEGRTVCSNSLKQYITRLEHKDYALGVAAVQGARQGGLRPNAQVYEALLTLLVESGQLKECMDQYQGMTRERMTPTQGTYALLMQLCLQRDMPASALTLFNDMQRRGLKPSMQTYELAILSYAAENPPQWEKAIAVFDKLTSPKNSTVNAQTYNALMEVYINMRPFDWRVVYNCYHEMRSRTNPKILLEWSSYELLSKALRLGKAGRIRRLVAYCDAWIQITRMWSYDFFCGVAVVLVTTVVFKTIITYYVILFVQSFFPQRSSESLIP